MVLHIGLDGDGQPLVHFHLYDSAGSPAADSGDVSFFPGGLQVHSKEGELLLHVPANLDEPVQYRLYNRVGELLTCSDGVCTKIEPCLRIEARPRGGTAWLAPQRRRPA